jgi:spermidine synthase
MVTAVLGQQENARDTGRWISELYSINTLGAVLGALGSGFVLIPWLGLDGAIYAAATLNASAALAVAASAGPATVMHLPRGAPEVPPLPPEAARSRDRSAALFLLILTGFASIAAEVGWTKYLSIVTGTTIYGFSMILAVFLAGITLGAWWARHRVSWIERPIPVMAAGLLALGVASFVTRAGLSAAPALQQALTASDLAPLLRQAAILGYVAIVLLPSTLVLGALFPLALAAYSGSGGAAGAHLGRAYATNTAAGIAGSASAGLWLIPAYGTDALLVTIGLVTCASGSLLALGQGPRPRTVATIAIAAAVVAAALKGPGLDYRALVDAVDDRYDDAAKAGLPSRSLFLREGRVGVVSVTTRNGITAGLQSNGLTESHIDLVDPRNGSLIEGLLGLLPYFVHESPEHAFVVGFGGGNTAYALATTFALRSIDVVELEPAVVDAVTSVTGGNVPALQDPRVVLTIGDARHALLTTGRRYQVIASQPSHPWLAGASSLFTREFFLIARSRLTTDGVFAQWLNLFRMDTTTLRGILKAFCSVFPHAVSLGDLTTGDLLLLGSPVPIRFGLERIAERMQNPATARYLARHGVRDPADILVMFVLSRGEMETLTADVAPSTDTNLLPEVRLAGGLAPPAAAENPYLWLRRHRTFALSDYLADRDRARALFDTGLKLVERGQFDGARAVLEGLGPLDPGLAAQLAERVDPPR